MPKALFDNRDVCGESPMDRIVQLACTLLRAPAGMVVAVGDEGVDYRSSAGLRPEWLNGEVSVTRRLMAKGPQAVLVIEDAARDPHTAGHPWVTGSCAARFYAGAVVCDAEERPVGALCVIDFEPRTTPSLADLDGLKRLAALAADLIGQDVSRRDQAEQLGILNLAEGMAGVGRWRLDVASGRVAWSDEVYRIHGLERGAFDPSYDDAVGCYHPDDQEAVRRAVEHALRTGEAYEFKLRLLRPDGEERLVLSRGACELDAAGRATAAFGVFQDVTEAEAATGRLKDSEARYRLLADRATDVIVTYEADGVLTYVSPSIQAVTGHRAEDLVGRHLSTMIHADDFSGMVAPFQAFARDPNASSLRLRYRSVCVGGEIRWLETRVTAIRDAEGRAIRFQDIIRDVTDTKRLEDELTEARDKAEAAARAKSEFLANMSHELRTPLTSVIGFSGVLQKSAALPEAERGHVQRIATASEALLAVINDILDYSKLEANAVVLEARAFAPRSFADGLTAMIEGQCLAKGVSLIASVSPEVPEMVVGDEGRLRQVSLNLLSNAVKFTADGEVSLGVGWTDGRLVISVRDTGIGIAPDKIEGLFERFSQADNSTTRVYGGTGLGLSISRRLVRMMGGELEVESRPGAGSVFRFACPLELGSAPVEPWDAVDEPLSTDGLRILMVDDAAPNRELISVILGGLGAQVDLAEDGLAGVAAAAASRYDVILMDLHMPGMDGIQATRAVRGLPDPFSRTPIIALTADVQPEQVAACRAAGMDGHVGKPIQVPDLLAAIHSALTSLPQDVAAHAA